MNAKALLENLRCRHISLEVEEDNLRVDAPAGAITEEMLAALVSYKHRLIKLLAWGKRKLEDAGRCGILARRSRNPRLDLAARPYNGRLA